VSSGHKITNQDAGRAGKQLALIQCFCSSVVKPQIYGLLCACVCLMRMEWTVMAHACVCVCVCVCVCERLCVDSCSSALSCSDH